MKRCENCRWVVMGLFLPACANPDSQFYGRCVHPDGGCTKFERHSETIRRVNALGDLLARECPLRGLLGAVRETEGES